MHAAVSLLALILELSRNWNLGELRPLVPIFAFLAILVLMVLVLIVPDAVRNVIQWRVQPEARSDTKDDPRFAVIMIFLLGIGLFYEAERMWPPANVSHVGPFELYSGVFGAVFLAAMGVFACLWPMHWMRLFVEQLRRVPDDRIDTKSRQVIVVVAKLFGASFLLASSYVVHLLARSI